MKEIIKIEFSPENKRENGRGDKKSHPVKRKDVPFFHRDFEKTFAREKKYFR